MMKRKALYTGLFLVFAGWVGLVGCATSRSPQLYELNAMPKEAQQDGAATEAREVSVGVGPVDLPDYLDRPQIVTRTTPYQILTSEFDRWAEPLKANAMRVLAVNLSTILGTERIDVYPWIAGAPQDYQVLIRVTRFDGEMGGNVTLDAFLTVLKKNVPVTEKRVTLVEPTGGPGYEPLVSAHSRALEALSREIAGEIRAHPL